jgi:hypothetical protein
MGVLIEKRSIPPFFPVELFFPQKRDGSRRLRRLCEQGA